MRKIIKWLLILGIFVFIGLAIAMAIAESFHKMSDAEFCGNCHVMEPMVETWKQSAHGGNNVKGIIAKCGTCHTPQSSMMAYTKVKVFSGLHDVFSYYFDPPDAEFYLEKLEKDRVERAKKYVFESGCLSCHKAITESPKMPEVTKRIHLSYFENKQENDNYHCVSCHQGIAHPGLEQKLRSLKTTSPKE